MTSETIAHWKHILQRMREEDQERRVFGSDQHQYALGSTLSEHELLRFERERGITLPADYRQFLTEMGNGGMQTGSRTNTENSGAGPYYGVLSLADAADDYPLHLPIPYTKSTELMNCDEIEIDSWRGRDPYPGMSGALALCHQGCAIYDLLVVHGPAYGTMWRRDPDQVCDPTGISFETWYGGWIDRLEAHAMPILAQERSVAHISVGMSQTEVIAICGKPPKQERQQTKTTVSFDGLATKFEIDDSGKITWIFRHSIF